MTSLNSWNGTNGSPPPCAKRCLLARRRRCPWRAASCRICSRAPGGWRRTTRPRIRQQSRTICHRGTRACRDAARTISVKELSSRTQGRERRTCTSPVCRWGFWLRPRSNSAKCTPMEEASPSRPSLCCHLTAYLWRKNRHWIDFFRTLDKSIHDNLIDEWWYYAFVVFIIYCKKMR